LKIYWTYYAETKVLEIEDYYSKVVSERVAQKLINGIFETVEYLVEHPFIGQKEEMLEQRKEQFRYLVYKNYKIIYWVNTIKNQIEIMLRTNNSLWI